MTPQQLYEQRKQRADKLKEIRLKSGITKRQLFAASGLAITTINRIESGEMAWSVDSEILYLSYMRNEGK